MYESPQERGTRLRQIGPIGLRMTLINMMSVSIHS
jgi:hypothetical protein